jgi:tetratricopeptide (TPR) repeat protein
MEVPEVSDIHIYTVMEDGSAHRASRLYRKSCAAWHNAAHNIVKVERGRSYRVERNITRIMHDRTVQTQQQRVARSQLREKHMLTVLPQRIQENPLDTRSMFYLAQQHSDAKRWEPAYYWYERYCRTQSPNKWLEEEYSAAIRAAGAAFMLRDWPNVERMSLYACGLIPSRAEGYFQLGQMYYNCGEYEIAYRYLHEANLQPFENGELWVDREKHTDGVVVLDLLVMTCWKLRKFQEGLNIVQKLVDHPRLPAGWKKRIEENKRWFEKNVK